MPAACCIFLSNGWKTVCVTVVVAIVILYLKRNTSKVTYTAACESWLLAILKMHYKRQ